MKKIFLKLRHKKKIIETSKGKKLFQKYETKNSSTITT